ncbi:MAG: CBS domain-containing protein [Nitrososphaeria archaeon]
MAVETKSTNPANLTVRQVMNSPVITGKPNETVRDIAKKMTANEVGSIVIVENGKPVGMVTDGDIIDRVISKGLNPDEVKAKDIMSTPILTVDSEATIVDAAKYMRKNRVKRVGVTYKGRIEGILSIWDIISITPEIVEIFSEKLNIQSSMLQSQKESVYFAGYCDICSRWSDLLVETDGKYVCEECRSD